MQPQAQTSQSTHPGKRSSWKLLIYLLIIIAFSVTLLGSSAVLPSDQTEKIRLYTRNIEFDYIAWTLDALGLKFKEVAIGSWLISLTGSAASCF